MQVLYSSGRSAIQRVVAVLVGSGSIPTAAECRVVLTMDPEIEVPVLVIPFGGLPFDQAEDDDAVAKTMILQAAPGYAGDGYSYRCTRIRDVLLIKVLAARTIHDPPHPREARYNAQDIPLN